jgi:hypothetical protein
MLSTQTNIALQIVATLSEEEKAMFANEFNKMYQPTIKPKKVKKSFMPDPHILAEQYLARHRAKYDTPDAR